MSSFTPIRYQCRSADSIYMFQLSSEELSLKILSVSKEVLFDEKFSSGGLPFLEFNRFFSEGKATSVLSDLVRSQLLPQEHLPSKAPKEVIALAEILKESAEVKEVIHAYYKEAIQSFFDKDVHRLSLCTREIRQIDPQMEHLSTDQKIHLLTQEHIVSLSEELRATQQELQYMKRLKAFELMDIIKSPGMRDSQRENAIDFLRNMTVSSVEYEPAIRNALFAALGDGNAEAFVRIAAAEFLAKLLEHSISDGERQRLRHILRCEREQRVLDKVIQFTKREKSFLSDAFGEKDWETHFGTVDEVPPLPKDIEEILNSPCPFNKEAVVGETHILVLIPQKVDGKLLTLNSFADLIAAFPKEKKLSSGKHKDGNNRLKKSYWILMTKDPIPGSINTHGEKKMALIKKYPSYSLPIPVEAAAGITLYYLRHGSRIDSFHKLCRQNGNGPNLSIKGSSGGGYYCNEAEQVLSFAGITGVLRL